MSTPTSQGSLWKLGSCKRWWSQVPPRPKESESAFEWDSPGAVRHSTLWEAFPHLPLLLGRVAEPLSLSTAGIVLGANVFGRMLPSPTRKRQGKGKTRYEQWWRGNQAPESGYALLISSFLQESRGLHSSISFTGTNSSRWPFRKERQGGDTLTFLYCSFSLWMMEFAVAGYLSLNEHPSLCWLRLALCLCSYWYPQTPGPALSFPPLWSLLVSKIIQHFSALTHNDPAFFSILMGGCFLSSHMVLSSGQLCPWSQWPQDRWQVPGPCRPLSR